MGFRGWAWGLRIARDVALQHCEIRGMGVNIREPLLRVLDACTTDSEAEQQQAKRDKCHGGNGREWRRETSPSRVSHALAIPGGPTPTKP